MKTWLEHRFDHTLVLNDDDPFLPFLMHSLHDATDTVDASNKLCSDLAKIVTVPNCGAEGLAMFLHKELNNLLQDVINEHVHIDIWKEWRSRYLRIIEVTVYEDTKNSATYRTNV
jgi:hypothetical protein